MISESAERKDTKSTAAISVVDSTVPSPVHATPTRGDLIPKAGETRATSELLDPRRVSDVRRANLDGQLKSNFWFEVSRIAMWATTGLIALTVGAVFAAAGTPLAVMGPFIPLVGAVAAGAVLIASSQHSKQTFANRWFDVQDFQMQRQAALVGKSVERAMTATAPIESAGNAWTDRFQPRTNQQSWAEAVQTDKANPAEAHRA